ncbi:hypothetical protein KDJ56_13520 [Brevibacillus composti]|uniref:Uncharacterized protein n=1 Tax=Brevibacillus composti TaxID=2796470 RepID=A0A7T5EHZ1_9BACL|nr:hypothetical protein [Brevibacillus composti]QQE72964.1 hypothetical protein JD108_13575 [Brevibacillus composti]QUO40042.1 hypothetical protein KDJ56_13520 [Brevibacillus composti]
MKRVTFASLEELKVHCQEHELSLVIEYQDEVKKQRQVVLAGERLTDADTYLGMPGAMAYYRRDGVFYEVIPAWQRGG